MKIMLDLIGGRQSPLEMNLSPPKGWVQLMIFEMDVRLKEGAYNVWFLLVSVQTD